MSYEGEQNWNEDGDHDEDDLGMLVGWRVHLGSCGILLLITRLAGR